MVRSASASDQQCLLCGETAEVFSAFIEKAYGVHVDRLYWQCPNCRYLFLDPNLRLSPEREKARYQEHNNDPTDPGYRAFLGQVWHPLAERLNRGTVGLDYGCGPGSPLRGMAAEQGLQLFEYDPFFAPDDTVLDRAYDFLVCTEALEHFYHPYQDLRQWSRILRADAWIGIMTALLENPAQFTEWSYRKDPTHVGFFQPATLHWIADHFGWQLEILSARAALFQTA